MESLLDSIRAFMTADLIGKAARRLQESENGTAKMLRALAPTVIAALLQRLSETGALTELYQQVTHTDAAALHHPQAILETRLRDGHSAYSTAAENLLGARLPAVRNGIAAFAAARPDSVSPLLDVVFALSMGVLTTRVQAGGMNPAGLSNLLFGERELVYGALPTGMATILGLRDYGQSEPEPTDREMQSSLGLNWLWPLLGLAAAGLAAMWLAQGC